MGGWLDWIGMLFKAKQQIINIQTISPLQIPPEHLTLLKSLSATHSQGNKILEPLVAYVGAETPMTLWNTEHYQDVTPHTTILWLWNQVYPNGNKVSDVAAYMDIWTYPTGHQISICARNNQDIYFYCEGVKIATVNRETVFIKVTV